MRWFNKETVMKRHLSEALYQTAVAEVIQSLQDAFGDTIAELAEQKAENILTERLELILKDNADFERRLEGAVVKAHLASLRAGHYKALRHLLRVEPGGVTKPTAKAIIAHIFGLKGD